MRKQKRKFICTSAGLSLLLMLTVACSRLIKSQSQPLTPSETSSPEVTSPMDPMALYRSVDRGEHWDLIAQTDDANPSSLPNGLACTMTFISSERGFMALCGAAGGLIMSEDGGQTWKNVELESQNKPANNCLAASSTSQLIFMDAQQGWVIQDFTNFCESSTQSLLYRTLDGGVTWKQVATTFQP